MKQPSPPRPLQPVEWVQPTPRPAAAPRVRPLTDLALDSLANNPESITDLSGTAEHLAIALLQRLFTSSRLNYRLAILFRESGHESIREAMSGLDLLAAIPTHNTLNHSGCKGLR